MTLAEWKKRPVLISMWWSNCYLSHVHRTNGRLMQIAAGYFLFFGGSTPTTLHFTCWLCIQHHLQRHPCFVRTKFFSSLQAWRIRIKTQVASFTIGQLDRIRNVDNCPIALQLHLDLQLFLNFFQIAPFALPEHSRIQDKSLGVWGSTTRMRRGLKIEK